jgi:hypothetical protein
MRKYKQSIQNRLAKESADAEIYQKGIEKAKW